MQNTKDLKSAQNLKCFVVGDSGTGKSIFASSFPTPAFVFDFDKGILSYREGDFDYEQYPSTGAGWAAFSKDLDDVLLDGKYKTIIIDSTTTMTDLAMASALETNRVPNDIPVWNVHYSIVKNLVEGKMRKLLDFKGNVVVIGHLTSDKDEVTGAVLVRPLLTGQLATKLPSYFDEVYYSTTQMKGGKNSWVLQTISKGYYKGRSRLSGVKALLPDFVENNYNAIMAHVNGEKNNG